MNNPTPERVLVLTPTGRDGRMIAGVLSRAGMPAEVCTDTTAFCRAWDAGAGAGVVSEEALDSAGRGCVIEALRGQPPWSDFPLVVLTGGGHTTRASTSVAHALETRGNVTLLERPLRMLTLISAVQTALRARRRQYEVRRLLEESRQAVEQRDQFLATLAHELRNPLAPIRNGLQVIRLAGVSGTVEQARIMMDRQLTHLVRLLDDLLDVSRITRGKLELRKERLELKTAVDAAVETARPVIEQAGHDLVVTVPGDSMMVDGDATRLAQVVSNLLHNAAKYTHHGGHIRLTVRREGGVAVLSVADNGIGIPSAMLDKVFQMFAQVDRTLEKTTGGLGIGLSLIRGLVEMHGGTIEAHSDGEGRGSEFVVRMPLAVMEGSGRTGSEANKAGTAVSGHRILVVDDNVDSADSLGQLLELLGNDVRTAYDGEAGVGAATAFHPDLILMDIGMPKLNGYDAARRIREQPWGREVVMVAQTGWGQHDDKRKSQEAGFDFHLTKPVETAALMKLLAGLQPAT